MSMATCGWTTAVGDPLADRLWPEGFSPKWFADLKAEHIAILTHHKHPGENWPAEEFRQQNVRRPSGVAVERQLAERGTCLSNGLWVREVRMRDAAGPQSSPLRLVYR